MRLVVQVQTADGFLRDRPLYLRPLVPFVEGRDGDDLGPGVQRCLQGGLVIASIHAVAGVVVVPGSDAGVDVAGPHAGDEEEVVAVAEGPQVPPVLVGGAVGEPVGGKIRVHPVEAGGQDVVLVSLLHHQGDEDGVVSGSAQTVRACRGQKFSPGLWGS